MSGLSSQLRGMDLVRWLDNQLGNTNELWSGRQASTILSREILNELTTCFQALEPHVKLKIIEAIPHLSPKLVQMWRIPLNNLLQIAKDDADNWIRTVAKIYINYPNTNTINCDITDMDKQFENTVNDFQKMLDNLIPKLKCNVIPPDSIIVNPAATQMAYGYSVAEPKQHFSLKKALKYEQMMQDALKLAQSSAHNHVKRSFTSSLPIKVRSTIRRPDNTLPMRGIPSIPASRISSGFSNEPKKFQRNIPKRVGGAMLIDISDLPQAPNMKKKRGSTVAKTDSTKKRGDGRKPHNQESEIRSSDAGNIISPNRIEYQHSMEVDSTPNFDQSPFAPTAMPPIQRRMNNAPMYDGAFSFI